jgi:hypothetical protein
MKLLDCLRVVSEIGFQANEDDGEVRAEVEDFGNPLFIEHALVQVVEYE